MELTVIVSSLEQSSFNYRQWSVSLFLPLPAVTADAR
jgi:hypothetical protein